MRVSTVRQWLTAAWDRLCPVHRHGDKFRVGVSRVNGCRSETQYGFYLRLPVFIWHKRSYSIWRDAVATGWHALNVLVMVGCSPREGSITLRLNLGWVLFRETRPEEPRAWGEPL